MKAQANSTVRPGKSPRESSQFRAAAIRQRVRPAPSQPIPATDEFTLEDHLNVQREIEERAHRLWLANGRALHSALNDWCKAENEVLAEFLKRRTQRHPVQPPPRQTNTSHGWKETHNEKICFMNLTQNDPNNGRYSAKNSHPQVSFYCAAPRAASVELAGDFNHWHPLPMQRSVDGWWLAQVQLCHGHHQYRFLVDGKPMLDPHATGVVRDERGEQVSLLAVS